jgi:hypothetical protein
MPTPPVSRRSASTRLVMRKPDSVKNTDTPRRPPLAQPMRPWNRRTARRDRPRRPSRAGQ